MQGLVLAAVLAVAMAATVAPTLVLAADPVAPAPEQVEAPTRADEINPYLMQGLQRDRLAELYPNLPAAELDLLVQRIDAYAEMKARIQK